MKSSFFKLIASITLVLLSLITTTHAAVITAPPARYQLFLDSTNPAWSTNYTAVSTTSLGTMKFLKYSTAVQTILTSSLAMGGKYASSKVWNGGTYQQISEVGYLGECVGFAKAMTGIGGTSTWVKSSANALATIFPNGLVVGTDPSYGLAPGAMIVNYDGRTTYTNNVTNHTAIVLSVVVMNGKITGANVVGQNSADTAGGIGGADRMISKYFLPWTNSISTKTSLALKNYHVLTAP